ncbi:MAG: Xaa-Pro peptidase family protein [Trichlorobacter sp.]|jgi:Xaa-Pro aminopeptidase|nr:Xaa-Pro peptidase family protein [Trichlorobacter sp.]
MLKNRIALLQPFFAEYNLDLLLVEHPVNLRYLTGFSGSEASLLLSVTGNGWFICDSRYSLQAAQETSGLTIVEKSQRHEAVAEIISNENAGRTGFESTRTTVANFEALSGKITGCQLVAVGAELERIRDIKDALELQKLSEVAALASRAFETVLPMLKPGITEADFALQLEFEMRRSGANACGFDIIVASGERGAMPHGRASGKQIKSGELVTVDFGAVLDGYHSDETVTVAVGEISEQQKQIHDIVKAAHDLAILAVKPGILCRELDAIARDYIKSKGYGDFFGHGLGHGVGLDIHEKPVISPRSEAMIEEGMVFTIEPGIYLPDRMGVRIEDTVAVTKDGCKILTKVDKELITVG